MRIVVEVDGYRMVIDHEDINMSTVAVSEEVACDCLIPCGYVHRRLGRGSRLEISADLPFDPQWERVS